MGHQHNRPPQQAVDAQHLLLQRLAGHRVEGAEGLIHQQHLRICRQRPRHPHPLLLAAGELMRVTVAQRRLQP